MLIFEIVFISYYLILNNTNAKKKEYESVGYIVTLQTYKH